MPAYSYIGQCVAAQQGPKALQGQDSLQRIQERQKLLILGPGAPIKTVREFPAFSSPCSDRRIMDTL